MGIKIHSRFDRPTGVAQSFEKTQAKYEMRTDANGVTEVQKTGVVNIYDAIQEANVGLEITDLIKKYTGEDGSLLQEAIDPSQFGDSTLVPKSMLEAHMKINDLKNRFANSSVELRQKYGFDFGKFLSSLDENGAVTDETIKLFGTKKREEVKDEKKA